MVQDEETSSTPFEKRAYYHGFILHYPYFVSAIAAASVDPYSYHQGHSLKNCPQHAIHQQVMAGRTLNRGHVRAKLAQRIPLLPHQSNPD
ncbi:hypothetical protein DSO57_1039187 [Entomophthora muscae]|uniref:Uncharacterized protein n=1 Tax=Entomophthora muscae TaxID=34485 RepID=A0ACC2TKK5_9FUNG|nr:hypothetical protein DSO57_1039187 [Entomophthora muscae]